jgi:hypothetical protein
MTGTEDILGERLTGALRELAQQAPTFGADAPELGRPPGLCSDTHRRGWTRPWAIAVMVATVGGVAAVAWQSTSGTGANVGVDHGVASSPSQSPSELTRNDDAVVSKSAVDRTAAQATAFELEPGYGRVSVDYAAGAVDVLWKGQPPVELQKLVEQPGDVTLTLHEVAFAEADITAAAHRLIQARPSEVDGAKVVTVIPNADLSGATVAVLRPWDGSQRMLRDVAGMPIEIVLTDEAVHPAKG